MSEVTRIKYRTLEPVHIGTGGYRLGRVDKSICREPGTNLPKIPGTSLSGAARAYAAELCNRPWASGAKEYKGDERDKHCPIFYTFGHASGQGGGNAGTVTVGDAYILLFPVASLLGCVWITTKRVLTQARIDGLEPATLPDLKDGTIAVTAEAMQDATNGLNLGWLWFAKDADDTKTKLKPWSPPDALKQYVTGPLVLVCERLFAPLVNSNLEVRTSVSINHETGTVEGTKLFSYEAIPRETIMFQEAVEDNYRNGWTDDMKELSLKGWGRPKDVLLAGLGCMSDLGVGGMGTRGFGRMEMIAPAPTPEGREQ
jgi:CRISPR-associated protein Cmr4